MSMRSFTSKFFKEELIMKKAKAFLAVAMAATLTVGLTACGRNADT